MSQEVALDVGIYSIGFSVYIPFNGQANLMALFNSLSYPNAVCVVGSLSCASLGVGLTSKVSIGATQ